jgi:hypothetical protein
MADQKEPFVGQGDRPEVSLKPDAPISGLTVRDLGALLGEAAKVSLKYLKDVKYEKFEKVEKWEHPKYEKFEKWEHPKFEKVEKWEQIKYEKNEKLEIDIFRKVDPEGPPDPTRPGGDPDPIDRLISVVSRLEERVKHLENQVKEIGQTKMK